MIQHATIAALKARWFSAVLRNRKKKKRMMRMETLKPNEWSTNRDAVKSTASRTNGSRPMIFSAMITIRIWSVLLTSLVSRSSRYREIPYETKIRPTIGFIIVMNGFTPGSINIEGKK